MSENKPIYILSLEASDIYNHMNRGNYIKYDYCGMIPYSLESIKLQKEGLKVKYIESRDKYISNDIINVKFKQKVKSGKELKKIMEDKKDSNKGKDEYINKLNKFINTIDLEKWKEVSVNDLRKKLYNDGFIIRQYDKKSEKYKDTEYVVYKRSSSKSRTGQCLFIKKSLYNKMIKWSRMYLPLRRNMKIDLAGLLAYESLVGSSLESTIQINPKNILIVSDVDSKFKQECNVVKKGKDEKFLNSFKEIVTVSNSLFDGESLLEAKYFSDDTSMKLLRNHMFKSAAFNCNIQQFLMDYAKNNNINFDSWQIENMFGEPILAKDIELIITPSSLKALKFSHVFTDIEENERDKHMWNYWKELVENEDNIFGVVKHEKPSKFGTDENGNVLQQTSYQMINCLPIKENDIEELVKTEKEYIDRLKNDDDFFMERVLENANTVNSNEMLYALYSNNNEIINTELYRKFRKKFIWNHINNSKKGKIKLIGDYCVLLGNAMEFLYHAIGEFDVKNPILALKDNQVYTKLFKFNKELVGFRNPNTSPSNVLVVNNVLNKDIEKYFNLTKNIVCVNAVNFAIQDILSGCDYDSDTVLLFDNKKMLEMGKRCFGTYYVCFNDVEGQKKSYSLNANDMCKIDNQLSTSQRNIGKVVNLGQFSMSVYWDLINTGERGKHVEELLKKVDVMTVLSGIAIDMAKKFYEIDINKEINNVLKNKELQKRKNKPIFWKYVSQSKTIKKRIERYKCPMDYLIDELDKIDQADRKEDVDFDNFIYTDKENRVNKKQLNRIIESIRILEMKIKNINAKHDEYDEKTVTVDNLFKSCLDSIKKMKINENTMFALIKTSYYVETEIFIKILKVLYESQNEIFMKIFKKW